MRLRFGLACAVAVLLSGCGGKSSSPASNEPASTEQAPTSTIAPEEAEQKRQEEEDNAKAKSEEERMIHEHEPGRFGP